MTAVKEQQDVYFSQFAELKKRLAGKEPGWLEHIRKAAFDRFADLGFPTTKNEEWKYTSVAPLARIPFELTAAQVSDASFSGPEVGETAATLVFVDGRFSPEASRTEGLPGGVKVGSLSEVLRKAPGLLELNLARYAPYQDNAFAALNTAFMEDGAFVEIPKDTALHKPIYLLFVSTSEGPPAITHSRNLILIGRGSQASLIEHYLGSGGVYFTNAVTEVVVGENAAVDYTKVQEEGERAFHIATLQFQQERSSSVVAHTISFGAALDREDTRAVLDGEGAENLMNGLYVLNDGQHVDNHTVIDHAKPHCGSREVYKGVLDGHSTGVFNGKIAVRKDAQKTDSKQSNKNLLLSENATINTKPQLEIYADDVKCTHGATIGQIDQEAVFYLRSRGIGLAEARSLLVQAFANDVLDRIKFESLRNNLRETLTAKLAQGPKPATRNQASEESRVSTLQET